MNKFMLSLIIFVLLILSSAATTKAFDGNRKGFVLGGDLGWTHFQKSKDSRYTLTSELTTGFIIGYAFNNKNMLVQERTIYWENGSRGYIMSQTNAITWFYYFKPQKESFLSKVGYDYIGKAIYLGGGYMLSNNIQFSITYSHLTKIDNRDNIKLLVSYVAF